MPFSSLLRDIRKNKFQGAYSIAQKGLQAMHMQALQNSKGLKKVSSEIISAYPYELLLRNVIEHVLSDIDRAVHTSQQLMSQLEKDRDYMISIGIEKIPTGSVVLTFGNNLLVNEILLGAQETEVLTVGTKGREAAKVFAKRRIPVTHFSGDAIRDAVERADLVLLGGEAISSSGNLLVPIGKGLVAEAAVRQQVPVYFCLHSLQLHTLGDNYEEMVVGDVWKNTPKHVKVYNRGIEVVEPDLVSGIISELGIFKPHIFLEEIARKYPWLI